MPWPASANGSQESCQIGTAAAPTASCSLRRTPSPPPLVQAAASAHLGLARAADVRPEVFEIPSLALDLDTPADLAELTRRLRAEPDLAPATAAALTRLELH